VFAAVTSPHYGAIFEHLSAVCTLFHYVNRLTVLLVGNGNCCVSVAVLAPSFTAYFLARAHATSRVRLGKVIMLVTNSYSSRHPFVNASI
jgi:hypothetical protein